MNLQERTVLVLLVTLIGVLSIIGVFVSAIYLSSFTGLEHEYVARDLNRAVNSLDDESATISAIVSDWGAWDETYDFVSGNKTDYVEKNLVPETYKNLGINLIVITDSRGRIAYSGAYDLRNDTVDVVPESIRDELSPGSPLLRVDGPHTATTGILLLPKSPLIFASLPIIRSDYSGAPQGVVIMGRYLDHDELHRLGVLTDPSLNMTPADSPALAPGLLSDLRTAGGDIPEVIQPLSRESIGGYALIRDIHGRDALVLSIVQPRDIYTEGVRTTLQFIAIILVSGLFLGIVILLFIDRFVLSRIGALSGQVYRIGSGSGVFKRVTASGDDELSGLATEINRMLDTIEKTQEKVSASEIRFRELAEQLPLIIFEIDTNGGLTYVNKMGVDLFGVTEEKIAEGVNIRLYLSSENIGMMERGLARVMSGARSSGEIYTLKQVSGTVMKAIVYTSLIRREGGVVGFRGIVLDITARLELEAALRESEEKYRALTENTPDVLFSTDLQGIVTYVSPQINQYGFLSEEIVGTTLFDLLHAEDRPLVIESFSRELSEHAQFSATFRLTDKWGNTHWFEQKSFLQLDTYGKQQGVYGMLRDITERRRAEEAIELANKKLNLMNNITRHDILNTITGLLGCVDMANASTSPEERNQLLGDIKDLVRLIQRQISFTKQYQEVGVHLPQWQDVSEVLQRVLSNFENSGIHFSVEIERIEIFADPLLEKVFYNLVDNALRYGKTISTIKFYFAISNRGLSLICEDDGVGIPEDYKQYIFDRGVGQNTGMGLFISREILGITRIEIEENGVYGEGARFVILFPLGTYRFKK